MADNIVGGLFGVDPQQLAQQRQEADFIKAYKFAQLDPLEQAKMSIYQGGMGVGRGVNTLLGGDAELQKTTALRQLAGQFDTTSPDGLRKFAMAARQIAPQEAIAAAAKADEMERSGLGLQKTRAEIAKAELSTAQEEKLRAELVGLGPNPSEEQVINVVTKYGSPDKILQILTQSQDRKLRRAEIAATKAEKPPKPLSAGLQKSEDADLLKIDNLQAQSDALTPSIQNLTKDEKGVRALELNPSKIAVYNSQNLLGRSTPESIKYSALKSAVDTAVNLQVSAEKGVQTDKDVLRFAKALIAAYGNYDSEATLEALKNYNNAVNKAKQNTQKIIQSRRKSQGVQEYDFAPEAPSVAPTTAKKTRKLASGVEVTIEE